MKRVGHYWWGSKGSGMAVGRVVRNQSGQAITEFLVIFFVLLLTVMLILQIALIIHARSFVRYAAYSAARTGIVHQGDKNKMEEAAVRALIPVLWKGLPTDDLAIEMAYIFASLEGTNTDVNILAPRAEDFSGDTISFVDSGNRDKTLLTVEVTHRYLLIVPLADVMVSTVSCASVPPPASPDVEYTFTKVLGKALDCGMERRIPLTATYTMRMQSDPDRTRMDL